MPFSDYLNNPNYPANSGIVNALNNNRFPFSENILFRSNPSEMGAREYNRCVEYYLEKTPGGSLRDLTIIMARLLNSEEGNEKRLEELAIKVVREMYGIPESISLTGDIEPSDLDLNGNDFDEEDEPLTDEEKSEVEPHIQKRIILNAISHGAAVHQWTSAFYLAYEELNDINEDLVELYEKYSALINFYNWQHGGALMDEESFKIAMRGSGTQGFNKIKPEGKDEETKLPKGTIEGHGINFPVLIHELSKGALDYLLLVGIPQELSDRQLKYMYSIADKYSHEFWHYYLGPTLWRSILSCSGLESQRLPRLLSYMAKMDYEELAQLCIQLVFDEENQGKTRMESIKKLIKP